MGFNGWYWSCILNLEELQFFQMSSYLLDLCYWNSYNVDVYLHSDLSFHVRRLTGDVLIGNTMQAYMGGPKKIKGKKLEWTGIFTSCLYFAAQR